MEIKEDPQFRAEIINKIREREFNVRTGIHQSDLNYCLNKQALRKFNPVEDSEQDVLVFSVGWSTQSWISGQTEDEPELEKDGIIVTRDALYQGVPWELKATWQSASKPIEENLQYIRQIMAQCYVQEVTEAYLTRFELAGDWGSIYPKGSTKAEKAAYRLAHPKPTLHAYKLSFTQQELEKNWAWFKDRKELYQGILDTKKLLPKILALPPGGSWECSYCSYRGDCDKTQQEKL